MLFLPLFNLKERLHAVSFSTHVSRIDTAVSDVLGHVSRGEKASIKRADGGASA
jgi:hypothetical protein